MASRASGRSPSNPVGAGGSKGDRPPREPVFAVKKLTVVWLVLALLLCLGGGVATWSWRKATNRAQADLEQRAADLKLTSGDVRRAVRSATPGAPAGLSAAERMARADKIRRDYDEMTTKFSADYAAAGNSFPGGLSAYLRQLALLQVEKHKDLAALLTPRELEDIEMRDTTAGQTVQKLLGDTAATEEQRRVVFRLQKEFEDQFALTFDLTPPALLTRESARQATQQQIHAVLGDELFGAWLRGEGADYAAFTAYVQQAGLSANVPLDLWRAKNDFIIARLQLKVRTDLAPAQVAEAERALISQVVARVTGLLGPAAVAGPGRDILTWLPLPPAK